MFNIISTEEIINGNGIKETVTKYMDMKTGMKFSMLKRDLDGHGGNTVVFVPCGEFENFRKMFPYASIIMEKPL